MFMPMIMVMMVMKKEETNHIDKETQYWNNKESFWFNSLRFINSFNALQKHIESNENQENTIE